MYLKCDSCSGRGHLGGRICPACNGLGKVNRAPKLVTIKPKKRKGN